MDEYIFKCLHDVQESIFSINTFLGEKRNFVEYKSNKLL